MLLQILNNTDTKSHRICLILGTGPAFKVLVPVRGLLTTEAACEVLLLLLLLLLVLARVVGCAIVKGLAAERGWMLVGHRTD